MASEIVLDGLRSFHANRAAVRIDNSGGNWGVAPDGGNTFLTLAAWQSQGYEPHSFIATSARLWVNPAAGNYLLLPGSPAINAG